MADGPTKTDIDAIFKRLRSSPANKQCFDCGAMNPTWASVTYGVFLCMDCSAVHRSLGVHLTFIRSTQLDTTWTWMQLRAMQMGGNANATAYFRQHGCITNDAQQKYNSRAATLYREKLRSSANKAMQTYGTKVTGKLHIDAAHQEEVHSPTAQEKEVDFFKEHQDAKLSSGPTAPASEPILTATNGARHVPIAEQDPTSGPSVEAALSTSPTQAVLIQEPRKPTIGARKPASAKKSKGLGTKKGLGAQKVKTNFNAIEQEAQARDRNREEEVAHAAARVAQTKEDEEKKMASVRLAYKDLSLESKRQDEKMKKMDPKKREQMERLGMGMMGNAGTVSHSSLNDMKTIEQETPTIERERNSYGSRNRDFEDDFEFIGGFSSGPPNTYDSAENQYNDSPFGLKKEDRYSNWGSSKSSAWDSADRYDKPTVIEEIPSVKDDDRSGRSRKNFEVCTSEEAQKKFGSAKSISSDQFHHKDSDFEMRQNLSKFDGKASISSAELFGNGPAASSRGPYGNSAGGGAGPDLSEIKEGVRQGVTKVAGKLSSLANGVMSSIQDHYG